MARVSQGADKVTQDSTHRLNVNFSGEIYETLSELSRSRGKSMAEVIRDALALEKWLQDKQQEGDRVLIERNGQIREIVFRP